MIRAIASLALAALAAVNCQAADLTLEAKVTDKIALVTAKTEAKVVVWIPTAGLVDAIPVELLKDSRTRALTGKPGVYRVVAIAASVADKPEWSEVTFTIGTPEPEPAPKPGPVPPPPPVVDNLPQRLKDAYDRDQSPTKLGQLVNLRFVYEAMAKHSESDPDINTSRKLLEVLSKVKAGMLPSDSLLELRRILSAETAAAFGAVSDAPLDRTVAAAHFRRILRSLPSTD